MTKSDGFFLTYKVNLAFFVRTNIGCLALFSIQWNAV